jgi:hypothetical protein
VDHKSITRVTVGTGIKLAEDSRSEVPIGISRWYNTRRQPDGRCDIDSIHRVGAMGQVDRDGTGTEETHDNNY